MNNVSLVIFCCIAFCFFSCKKNGSSPAKTYSIEFNVDGEKKACKPENDAVLTTFASGQSLSIVGKNGETATSNVVTIVILSKDATIQAGTYTGSGYTAQIGYGTNYDGANYTNNPTSPGTDATVIITSISKTEVQGTFTATMINTRTNDTKQITSGTFLVHIQQ